MYWIIAIQVMAIQCYTRHIHVQYRYCISRCQGYKHTIKAIQSLPCYITRSVRGRRDIKHDNPHVLYDILATRPRARVCLLRTYYY